MSLFLYVNDHKMGEYPNEQLRELIAYARRQSATDEVELWRGYKKPEAMILRLAPETYLNGSVDLDNYPECWTIAIHDHPNAKKPVRYYGCWATRLGAEQVLEAIRIHIRRARRWRVIKR